MTLNCASKTFADRRVLAVVRHPVGGIRTHLLYTYPYLAERGYAFTFVMPAIDDTRSFRREVEGWPHVEVVEAPMDGQRIPQCVFVPTVRKLLRERRFQLIHSQGIRAATQAVLANIGIGVPHIATSQDMVRREEFPGIAGRLKLLAVGTLLSHVDTLVTVTSDARENHFDLFPPLRLVKRKVVPIVNGINTSLFQTDPSLANDSRLRRELGIKCDVFLAGFLGRFMEQKGFLVLVDAIEQLLEQDPPRPIHVVAVESGDFIREYQAILRTRPRVEACITFMPRQPNVANILRQLDALVMPSLWEACGILAMEAMAVGVPVIGSNCPGLREVLADTPSRTVPPNDPEALAQSLRDAMTSPRKEEAMAYAIQARDRFDARHTADSLFNLFEKHGKATGNPRSTSNGKALAAELRHVDRA
jgi:glycosyltransferase involved in cell wall biosynthesis